MASARVPSGRRLDIDGLRALGIVVVLLFHGHFLPGGFLGVDILFVISGFCRVQAADGTVLYVDPGHISRYAARKGAYLFEPVFHETERPGGDIGPRRESSTSGNLVQ